LLSSLHDAVMDTAPALLDLRSMARRLRVSMRWLRDEARAGRVPHLPAGARLLFDPAAVEQTLAERARQFPTTEANRVG